jgi:hypothetical protein
MTTWEMRDEFPGSAAAPLASPRTANPGPGEWTVWDPGNHLSIANGELVDDGLTSDARYLRSNDALARVAGRALFATWRRAATGGIYPWVGWMNAAAAPASANTVLGAWMASTGTLRVRPMANIADLGDGLLPDAVAGEPYHLAFVLRAAGGFVLSRRASVREWTLGWVGAANTDGNLRPFLRTRDNVVAIGWAGVTLLDGVWADNWGIATQRKAASVNGDTLAMLADALVEHTITAATGVTQELWVRRTDANNGWCIRMDQAGGTIKLIQVQGGVETERGSAAQTWTAGTQYRIVVVCDGVEIRTYVADTSKNTYTSASFNQSATGVHVSHAGANLVSWPRRLSVSFPPEVRAAGGHALDIEHAAVAVRQRVGMGDYDFALEHAGAVAENIVHDAAGEHVLAIEHAGLPRLAHYPRSFPLQATVLLPSDIVTEPEES